MNISMQPYAVQADAGKRLNTKQLRLDDSDDQLLYDTMKPLAVQASSGGSDGMAHREWQGAGPRFMQSNEHSQDRGGQWNSDGLQGAALTLVEGDKSAGRCVPALSSWDSGCVCTLNRHGTDKFPSGQAPSPPPPPLPPPSPSPGACSTLSSSYGAAAC